MGLMREQAAKKEVVFLMRHFPRKDFTHKLTYPLDCSTYNNDQKFFGMYIKVALVAKLVFRSLVIGGH